MESFFSLDVTGETFSEPSVVESEDPEEEESLINVKDSSDSRVNVAEEETKLVKISLASHIRIPFDITQESHPDLYELYRNITMDIRKFIYNSIVNEDFCVNCKITKESEGNELPNGSFEGHPGPENPGENSSSLMNSTIPSDLTERNLISPRVSMSVDGFEDSMRMSMEGSVESVSSSDSSDESSLESLSFERSDLDGNPTTHPNSERSGRFQSSDSILLELSPSKLNRTITEMAHVQMRRFFSSYPRSFKMSTGNVAADVYALGKRYYISNEGTSSDLSLSAISNSHVFYLAHLYRRQRSICYYCGFLKCVRSTSSKKPCEFQKCTRCLRYHRWSVSSCKGDGKLLEQHLQNNDWRNRRPNYWASQPEEIRKMLRCFYCNTDGEANFKCQGVSCPEGNDTLRLRCLELIGSNKLKKERHANPHLYPHLTKPKFVFDEKFKVNLKR